MLNREIRPLPSWPAGKADIQTPRFRFGENRIGVSDIGCSEYKRDFMFSQYNIADPHVQRKKIVDNWGRLVSYIT